MTRLVTGIAELTRLVRAAHAEGRSIGLVPTMGALHEGHQSLVARARAENDVVVASIFVNPLQFGPDEDYDAYPRQLEADLAVLAAAGCDLAFAPSVEEMYPGYPTLPITITVGRMAQVLEGARRPGHFDGVVTVVNKLFNLVRPSRAYFGRKDAQQLAIVQELVAGFNHDLQIVGVDIVREADGLARSSRNVYLSQAERAEAVALNRSLAQARRLFDAGERRSQVLVAAVRGYLAEHTSGVIDDLAIYSYPRLEEVELIGSPVLVSLAVKYSRARLIDNVILTPPQTAPADKGI